MFEILKRVTMRHRTKKPSQHATSRGLQPTWTFHSSNAPQGERSTDAWEKVLGIVSNSWGSVCADDSALPTDRPKSHHTLRNPISTTGKCLPVVRGGHGARALAHRIPANLMSSAVVLAAAMVGCRQPERAATPASPNAHESSPLPSQPPIQPPPTTDAQLEIPVSGEDPDRWLFVEKTRSGTKGGWATGSFDKERNRITIRTRDVEQFAVDTSRIEINWNRLVVLSIDDIATELARRNFDVYHLHRDRHGQWVVIEP